MPENKKKRGNSKLFSTYNDEIGRKGYSPSNLLKENKKEYGLSNKKRKSIKKVKKSVNKAYRLRLKNERPIHTRTVFQNGLIMKLDQFDRVMY